MHIIQCNANNTTRDNTTQFNTIIKHAALKYITPTCSEVVAYNMRQLLQTQTSIGIKRLDGERREKEIRERQRETERDRERQRETERDRERRRGRERWRDPSRCEPTNKKLQCCRAFGQENLVKMR